MNIGILALGRGTFDIEFANQKLAECINFLENSSHKFIGTGNLLLESEETYEEIKKLKNEHLDFFLIIQVTFTDASMTVKIAKEFNINFGIWAIPEPRIGGRLRLNSFCGLNLASHALSLNHIPFQWLYEDPKSLKNENFETFIDCKITSAQPKAIFYNNTSEDAEKITKKVSSYKIAKIGDHPEGFDTCRYEKNKIESLSGVTVHEFTLDKLFQTAKSVDKNDVQKTYNEVNNEISSLHSVNKSELDLSLRLKSSLEIIKNTENFDAFAIRCWPETFTEYGGAVCGPASMMSENKVPCACEADVYGSLTQLILQEASGSQVFLTDLVDIDINDNTGVVWHCGQAPLSMCDENFKPQATIHTNRKMPLLFEFPLKPGIVTLMRISQAFGEEKMIISKGQMLKRTMAFTGTSGVLQFDRNSNDVLKDIISSGLEHHMALTYGDHTKTLKEVASAMKIPVLEI